MLYRKNKEGIQVIPSLYAKEELPTWNEVYNEWYLNKIWNYNKNDPTHQELDPYWKIPKRKMLIGLICNQFNKMLFEDTKLKEKIVNMIKEKIYPWEVEKLDIKFICEHIPIFNPDNSISDEEFYGLYNKHCISWNKFLEDKFIGTDMTAPIYTIPLPTGKPNPFITNKFPRIDLSSILNEELVVHPIIGSKTKNNSFDVYEPVLGKDDDAEYIIEFMMQQFKEYFENGVGWKDENGNLIESNIGCKMCNGSGVDPAL